MPLFTIITATYNAAETLPRLLDSLAIQTFRDFNVVIQDGASSDATCSTAALYGEKIPQILLESQADSGIYDAWNRALQRARPELGDWVVFIGADDRLHDATVLERVAAVVQGLDAGTRLVSGGLHFLCHGQVLRDCFHPPLEGAFAKREKDMPVPHGALFYRKEVFDSQLFDASFRIAGDYEHLLRVWTDIRQLAWMDVSVIDFDISGISNDLRFIVRTRKEVARVRERHFSIKTTPRDLFKSALAAVYHGRMLRIKAALERSGTEKLLSVYRKIKNG